MLYILFYSFCETMYLLYTYLVSINIIRAEDTLFRVFVIITPMDQNSDYYTTRRSRKERAAKHNLILCHGNGQNEINSLFARPNGSGPDDKEQKALQISSWQVSVRPSVRCIPLPHVIKENRQYSFRPSIKYSVPVSRSLEFCYRISEYFGACYCRVLSFLKNK